MNLRTYIISMSVVVIVLSAGYWLGWRAAKENYILAMENLNRQIDTLVEMQNSDQDLYDMMSASYAARIRELQETCGK